MTETINIVILPENRCPRTINRRLKMFGVIVKLSWWFVTQQRGFIVNFFI